ncbi:MAG TPA: hypothetical protein ENH28_01230 [Euryarchaeota archaeon]|nr:sugar-specific transcriptional regulator TrmB [archaeon BMS3Bbin15]HDL14775.1 hypothetical protein [Euryarchaeota archaeon]
MLEAKSIICAHDHSIDFVMQCLLGIREMESDLYFALLEKPGTPNELSDRIEKSRSLIQRALQNLVAFGLAYRKPVRRARGRAYEYAAVSKDDAKKIMRKALKKWTDNIEKAIEEW